jgi:hypothetical protein
MWYTRTYKPRTMNNEDDCSLPIMSYSYCCSFNITIYAQCDNALHRTSYTGMMAGRGILAIAVVSTQYLHDRGTVRACDMHTRIYLASYYIIS